MAIPTWQPGRLYQPGDIVLPITMPAPTAAQVENGDFSAGNVNWDYTGGAQYSATGGYGNRGPCVLMPGSVPEGLALNKSILVLPQNASTFEASAMIQQGASIAGATRGWVEVRWFDADGLLLDSQRGNIVSDGSGGAWHKSTVTATRPAGAAYARAGIGLFSVADHSHEIFGDNLTVSGTFAGLPDGLVYKAVQAESGFSANTEPKWPPILGQTVVDNDVIWEAVASTRVTWEASPLYVSGTTEPDWPTDIGGYVRDGTIDWKAVSRRVEDANCPDSNIVAIAASKVFAGDDDIVRYSATVNPLDWTTADDAGYLPTGLQNYGSNPVAAMGLYRGNLAVFNAEGFQLWQVDEDPASMALIDALPLGSTEHRSVAPVANDLLFATSLGIRSLGVSASSTNYQAGDVGAPIDTLVKDALRVAKQNGSKVLATYYPGAGQYSLSFSNYPPLPLSIGGNLPNALVGSEITPFQYQAAGGVRPYGPIVIRSGALPPGLSLAADGEVTGTPTTAGFFSWSVAVTDADGAIAEHPDSAFVAEAPLPPMISGTPPPGQMMVPYGYQFTVSGDFPPFTVSDPSGSLPAGLAISAGGLLSGIPIEEFNGNILLRATDSRGSFRGQEFPMTIAGLAHWNAADKGSGVVLSDEDRIFEVVVASTVGSGYAVRGTQARSSGRYYLEMKWERFNSTFAGFVGLMTASAPLTQLPFAQLYSLGVTQNNQFNVSGTNSTGIGTPAIAAGSVVGIAVDFISKRCWMNVNGVWRAGDSPATHPPGMFGKEIPAGDLYPCGFSTDNNAGLSHQVRLIVESASMLYRPAGFQAWGGI